MAISQMSNVIQRLHETMLVQESPDGQLLENFVSRREEAALEALVRRHGPMVWSVCRRVLRNHQDAEDAFQATFLVFVRKAASIVPREMVGNWLYGVAHQTATKANATVAKRRTREKQVTEMPERAMTGQERWADLLPVLDQELTRLPDKYRVVIVLCDLEGKTRSQAAHQLGWPEGTVAGRLARARTALVKRLTQRGIMLSGGSVAAALTQQSASACVPPAVLMTTIKSAVLVAAGKSAAAIPTKVAALTEGVLKTMLLNKLKTAVTVLLVIATLVGGAGLIYQTQAAEPPKARKAPEQAGKEKPPAAKNDETPKHVTNSLGMKFVWIPPGNFMMGSPKEEKDRKPDENQHKVTLTKGFYMGVYAVTQEQWKEVMGNNPSKNTGEKNMPVDFVSWDDCQEFIKKLQARDKKPYRLPSEAEWEFSCRAGTTTPFHFGETISTDQANYAGDSVYGNGKEGKVRMKTTPVGTFPANAWGLHDMHGNVWQWCQDKYGEYPPKDVVDPQGPETTKVDRVLRGGAYSERPEFCRSSERYQYGPGVVCPVSVSGSATPWSENAWSSTLSSQKKKLRRTGLNRIAATPSAIKEPPAGVSRWLGEEVGDRVLAGG